MADMISRATSPGWSRGRNVRPPGTVVRLPRGNASLSRRPSSVRKNGSASPHRIRTGRTWLEICVEPEIHRIALIDGPSVLGWTRWRELCQRHVFGLVQVLLTQGIELGRIRAQPALPLTHVLMGAGDEAALYVAEAADRTLARAEMIEVLDQLIEGITA